MLFTYTEGNMMKKKELLRQLEQMRDSTREAIKWLDMPPFTERIWKHWNIEG